MSNLLPSSIDLKILKYNITTIYYGLNYVKVDKKNLIVYADAVYDNNFKDIKSLTSYIFKMANNSSPISWTTTKQYLTTTSSCYLEYVALLSAVNEILYLQYLLTNINLNNTNHIPATLYTDNSSCLYLANIPCHHSRTKHIDIRCHHIRDHINKEIILHHVSGDNNLADLFTKPLPRPVFQAYAQEISNENNTNNND